MNHYLADVIWDRTNRQIAADAERRRQVREGRGLRTTRPLPRTSSAARLR